MSSWVQARDQILTQVLANSTVPSARVNLSNFNGAEFTPPESDYATNTNAIWINPQVDSVPGSAHPLGVGLTAKMERLGLLTLSFYFMANTGETDYAAFINPLVTAMHRAEFGVVCLEDFNEPDYIGLDENVGAEFVRVDMQAGFRVQESSTESLIVDGYLRVESNPAAHGASVQQVFGYNESSTDWQKVVATTAGYANITHLGVVFHVPNSNDMILALPGSVVSITGHGLSGALYVDQSTPGTITDTAPTADVGWRVGTAVDANKIAVVHEQPIEL